MLALFIIGFIMLLSGGITCDRSVGAGMEAVGAVFLFFGGIVLGAGCVCLIWAVVGAQYHARAI